MTANGFQKIHASEPGDGNWHILPSSRSVSFSQNPEFVLDSTNLVLHPFLPLGRVCQSTPTDDFRERNAGIRFLHWNHRGRSSRSGDSSAWSRSSRNNPGARIQHFHGLQVYRKAGRGKIGFPSPVTDRLESGKQDSKGDHGRLSEPSTLQGHGIGRFQDWLIHWNGIHKKTLFLHDQESPFPPTLYEVLESGPR